LGTDIYFATPLVIIRYIELDEDVGKRVIRAHFILHASIKYDRLDMVRLAIQKSPACIHCRNEYGQTALIVAARHGHYAIVRLVISSGAVVDAIDSKGHAASFEAVDQGYESLVKLFLDLGASISPSDCEGDDLLGTAVASQAAFGRRLSWIRKHVGKRFGEVRIKESQIEESLSKMMDDATELKNLGSHMEFMTVLTEDSEQQHIIQMLLDSGAGLASMNREGETFLHLAIVSVDRLEQLWNSGLGVFNINARDVKGRTPLHYALAIKISPVRLSVYSTVPISMLETSMA